MILARDIAISAAALAADTNAASLTASRCSRISARASESSGARITRRPARSEYFDFLRGD
jgi:hypothetical protein